MEFNGNRYIGDIVLKRRPEGGSYLNDIPAVKYLMEAGHIELRSPVTFFIGENGTGKDVAAHALHELSTRSDKQFVCIDLGCIPETLFESELFGYEKGAFTDAKNAKEGRVESADGGTLFLDEIGNLSAQTQQKLLTVIEKRVVSRIGGNKSKNVDVRLICATNADLYAKVRVGVFRQDLLYRINTIELHLPPLRERGYDVILLAEYFIRTMATMPDVLDDIYGIPLENLSAALEDSYLGQMLDLELDSDFSLNLFRTEPDPKVQERLDAFTDTIKATPQEGKETLELDKERQCTAYDITFGTKELEKLLETLVDPDVNLYTALMTEYSMNELLDELDIEEIVDVLGDVELTYFVDDRGYFVGCDITYEDVTLCLRLTGSKNPWEEIRLYPEDMEDEALIITLDVDDDGMDLKVKMEGETLFRLKYEDSDGAISLEAGGEKMPSEWKINLVMDDKAPSFSLEYSETGSNWSETVSFYLGIAPLENEPKPLGSSYENILEMDEADFEDLMWEIQEKLSGSSSDVSAETTVAP